MLFKILSPADLKPNSVMLFSYRTGSRAGLRPASELLASCTA